MKTYLCRFVLGSFFMLGAVLLACGSMTLVACSSRHVEKQTVTVAHDPVSREEVKTVTTTSEIERSDSGGCGGILSCTVDVIGNIIALPFRAVGALINAIF